MAPHLEEGDWRPIAEQASKEMDPQNLTILIGKLCCALEGERRGKSQRNQASVSSRRLGEHTTTPKG
jgi:hypothetical protein